MSIFQHAKAICNGNEKSRVQQTDVVCFRQALLYNLTNHESNDTAIKFNGIIQRASFVENDIVCNLVDTTIELFYDTYLYQLIY